MFHFHLALQMIQNSYSEYSAEVECKEVHDC